MGQIQGGDEIITKGRLEAELQSFFNKIKPLISTGGRQWPVMPQASSAYANIIVQYIGESVPDSYTHAHFYECIENDGSYSWKESDITSVAYGVMDSTDLEEIFDGSMPTVENKMPILFDEKGEERKVGWYRLSNGTKKPVYEKTYSGTATLNNSSITLCSVNISNLEKILIVNGSIEYETGKYMNLNCEQNQIWIDNGNLKYHDVGVRNNTPYIITLQYTKTTDTPI